MEGRHSKLESRVRREKLYETESLYVKIVEVLTQRNSVLVDFFGSVEEYFIYIQKMKSQCGAVSSGRVTRPRKDMENEEIQVYLSKLKDLVPFMPRNRRLTKLEVIQYVIDYIVDLQEALEGPAALQAAAAVMVSRTAGGDFTVGSHHQINSHQLHQSSRQPLGVLAPNTILPSTVVSSSATTMTTTAASVIPPPPSAATTCSTQEAVSVHGRILLEKSSAPDPTIRPVSV